MLEVVKFRPEHVSNIETDFDMPKSFKDAFRSGGDVDAFTVMQGDTVVALGGIHVLWDGVGEGFCMLSKHSGKWQTSIARYARNMFEGIIQNNGLHRVQASIHESDYLKGLPACTRGQQIYIATMRDLRLHCVTSRKRLFGIDWPNGEQCALRTTMRIRPVRFLRHLTCLRTA